MANFNLPKRHKEHLCEIALTMGEINAIIIILYSIYNSADLDKSTRLVSLDLTAAFDAIDHSILKRLKISFGIDGSVLN